jgi:putative hemolysin
MRLLAEIAYTAALAAACLVLGDFLPRIITRREPERIAAATLPLMTIFALPFRPLYFLGSKIFWRPEFSSKEGQAGITEDELRLALIKGEKSGIVESKERTMVEGVFYLGDRPLGAFMTHRSEVQWLDVNASPQDTLAKAMENREQRCFPVVDGVPDDIIGAVYLEDIVLDMHSGPPSGPPDGKPSGLRSIMRKPLFAPETMPALKAFESFKQGEGNFLFVMDEYGGFAGMVSLYSLMEEIVGELATPVQEEKQTVLMEDGSWLVDGSLNIDDAAELLSLPGLAGSGDYHTLAGFVLSIAGELPRAGDSFSHLGYKFTVLDMDGNRIDKIGIKKIKVEE